MKRIHSSGGLIAAFAITAILVGCSEGGSINIGGGQEAPPPGTVDFPIFYVKRPIPVAQDDLRQQRDPVPGARLFMRNRASPSSVETDITARITGDDDGYDIKDVDVSQDGTRVIFAMHEPLENGQNEQPPPTWSIWEYDIPGDSLRRVIPFDATNAAGHDIGPQYLPDGRILFTSTRQRQSQAVLRDEGKPGYEAQVEQDRSESAFLLHVMNADGSDIQQITFNQSHDLWPSVMENGRVLFTRWDGNRGMHLYTSNPDGTDLQLHYGARSHDTGTPDDSDAPTRIQFTRAREMESGYILTLVRPFEDSDFGGDLVLIDANHYVERCQSLWHVVQPCPDSPRNPSWPGPGQARATPYKVSTVAGPSEGGRFRSAFPLWDGSNRLLVSWSLCRLLDSAQAPAVIVPCTPDRLGTPDFDTRYDNAPPLYSAFVYDPVDNTFRPLFQPEEDVMITDLVAALPRQEQKAIYDRGGAPFDQSLADQEQGLLEIRSVCEFDGAVSNARCGTDSTAILADPLQRTPDERPARFLRIEKAVSIWDIGDNTLGFPNIDFTLAVGSGVGYMREIIGYVPIEPDGSVSVRVPADVAFLISVLDGDGRRLFPQHRAWLQVRPGEIRRCSGCHQETPNTSHGRDNAREPNYPPWGAALTNPAFPNTLSQTAANAQMDDTMAQARARTSCIAGNPCSQQPSVDVIFDDAWTDPDIPDATPAESFAWTYYGPEGLSTPAPVRPTCSSNWNSTCRTIINYVEHIQPIWTVDRGANTCTSCHAPSSVTGRMDGPAGQLDLSGDPPEGQLHVVSYREFFFPDLVRDFIGGDLVVRMRPMQNGTDEDMPITATSSLTPGNARDSRFFACLTGNTTCRTGVPLLPPDLQRPEDAGGTVNHNGFLTPSELRLISEWVDIGAQYYNDPFADGIPTN